MSTIEKTNSENILISDVIKDRLYKNGGVIDIPLLNGEMCRVVMSKDCKYFTSNKLNKYRLRYDFSVFDVITDLLRRSKGGKANKGAGRGKNDKVGYGKCTKDTVLGAIAINYFGKGLGESTYDPVFVLAAIMDWAGVAHNLRGYIQLDVRYF